MSPKQVWSWWLVVQDSYFLSVKWCEEALYGLGVPGVKVLILLVAFFLTSVAAGLSKIFDLLSSHCLFLCPSHHLGSLLESSMFNK
jgi:hypothetical protein